MPLYISKEGKARLDTIKPDLIPLHSKTSRSLAQWLEDMTGAITQMHKAIDELERISDRYPNNLEGVNLVPFIAQVNSKASEIVTAGYFPASLKDIMDGLAEAAEDAMYAAQDREEKEEEANG